jgi:hypothetical protein
VAVVGARDRDDADGATHRQMVARGLLDPRRATR